MGDATVSYFELDTLRAKIESALECVRDIPNKYPIELGEVVNRRDYAIIAIANAMEHAERLVRRVRTPGEDGAA